MTPLLRLNLALLLIGSSPIFATSDRLTLPLSFEANHGQTGSSVKFLSRGDGYALFLTADSAVFKLRRSVVRMKLAGAQCARISGAEPLSGKVNYFIGADPAKWSRGIATYRRVEYKQVYKGIDLVYYGNQRRLEYDFRVEPGADPAQIALEFSGARPMLDAGGELQLALDGAPLRFRKPVVYQIDGGRKKMVRGRYQLAGGRVRFKLGPYDHSRALVIDPVLDYMTYLGGTGNDQIGWPGITCPQCTGNPPQGIAVDGAGNVYVTGYTNSIDFPLQGAVQSQDLTMPAASHNPTAFVAEISSDASTLIYATYLGGSVWDEASAIAVDSSGSVYVTGYTFSSDFPVTPGAYQTRCGATAGPTAGSIISNCGPAGNSNAFLTKLSPGGGSLVYSTFLGGGVGSLARAVAVDSQGQAYIAGSSGDSCFTGPGSFLADCFPETANALIPQSLYNATVTPGRFNASAAFVAVFDAAGANLLYSTLYGDTNPANNPTSAWATFGMGVAVDPAGNFYLTGMTYNPEIPTTPGALQSTYGNFTPGAANTNQGFVAKFGPVTGVGSGASLIYGTYLGGMPPSGSAGEQVAGIVADASGAAYVTGFTQSYTFPVTAGAADTNACTETSFCQNIGFLTKISPDGSEVVWSTLVGALPIAVSDGSGTMSFIGPPRLDAEGNVYITGEAIPQNSSYPLVNSLQPQPPAQQSGVFVTEYDPTGSTIYFSTVFYSPSGAGVYPGGVDVDSQGYIYVAGSTAAPDLITTSGVFQPQFNGTSPNRDGFIARINPFASATIQLSVAPNSASAGSPVTFTATMTGASGYPAPTGTVNFLNGTTVLGKGTLDANGVATFSSTTLASGSYSITAVYLGDGVNSSVTSAPQMLTIN